jgi:hypothetical protein
VKKIIVSAGLAALVASSAAHALRIDEATFKYYGGDSADLANSIKTHNDQLRAFSYETPWLAVGEVGGCTATWLGDNGGWTYVLTAAHCAGYQGTETAVTKRFTTLDRRVVASGRGTAYVPPQRINKPAGMGGASTDIAILKLPTLHPIADVLGKPVERPILNDDPHEKDRDVIFVGYGSWGVGAKGSGSYWPANGERRLYGRSRIDSIFELGYGIGASYRSAGPSRSGRALRRAIAGRPGGRFAMASRSSSRRPMAAATTIRPARAYRSTWTGSSRSIRKRASCRPSSRRAASSACRPPRDIACRWGSAPVMHCRRGSMRTTCSSMPHRAPR